VHNDRVRIKPTALVGVGVWILYGVIVVAMQRASGIPYTEFGDSASNLWRSVIPSLALGSLLLIGTAWWLGWFGAAMRDTHRTRIGWTLLAPAIYLVIAFATFAATDWARVGASLIVAALLLGVLVGFAEEFLCRGLLLVGLRGTFREVAVWALTCLLFGFMHGLNLFQGQELTPTVQQIILAGLQGSAFYILRRYFGSLVWAMALHGLWDASIFIQAYSGAPTSPLSALTMIAGPLALISGFVVARRTSREAPEPYAVAPAVA
jgi:membrane protease YdiL (CAAX protease family)